MKKSSFLTFILSMIPGCGLMYLGYMKKGLQMMLMCALLFFFALSVPYYFNWARALFILATLVVWFYQVFDSMHTVSRMKREGIEVPLDDIFYMPENLNTLSPMQNPKIAKALAIALILIGGFSILFAILNNMYSILTFWGINPDISYALTYAIRDNLVPVVVSIALIIIGARLLKGKKVKKEDSTYSSEEDDLS